MRTTLLTLFCSIVFLTHFNLLQFISVHISHSPSVSNAFPIPIRIYKFSASRLPQSQMLIEFFVRKLIVYKRFVYISEFFLTNVCVIISKFEIASRAPADSGHGGQRTAGRVATTWTASVLMMISPRSNIIIVIAVVCVCLFVARVVALPLWRWALAKCYLEEVHTEIKCVNVKNLTTIAKDRRTDGERTGGRLTITGNVNLLCVQSKFASEFESE